MMQYYRDLWPRRSHILQPFSDVSSGKKGAKIKWTPSLEEAFQEIKKMVSQQTLLTYPDWSKPFVIHTDASDYQLGAVISQDKKPIAFFSRKLNSAQKNYTTTEKELLSIVETLKEFRNILFGYPVQVFSDHKNLVHAATISQSQRVMRWRLILEEFGPDIKHISGEDNVVADAMSRLPTTNQNQKEHCTVAPDSQGLEIVERQCEGKLPNTPHPYLHTQLPYNTTTTKVILCSKPYLHKDTLVENTQPQKQHPSTSHCFQDFVLLQPQRS